jgi:hypothetical protein
MYIYIHICRLIYIQIFIYSNLFTNPSTVRDSWVSAYIYTCVYRRHSIYLEKNSSLCFLPWSDLLSKYSSVSPLKNPIYIYVNMCIYILYLYTYMYIYHQSIIYIIYICVYIYRYIHISSINHRGIKHQLMMKIHSDSNSCFGNDNNQEIICCSNIRVK